MMKHTHIFAAAALSLLFLSCGKVEEINRDLDKLEGRIAALEETVTEVNDNAVAVHNLMASDIVITSFTETVSGYEMTLNNGQTISVHYGKDAPGVVPIIGVDKDGKWICSIDGGKTFSEIQKSTGPFDAYGKTPMVKVDAEGYWLVSVDSGKTWTRLVNENGLPVSAVDGREVALRYAFFTFVEPDALRTQMTFNLATGESITVPLKLGADIEVVGYKQGETIFSGATVKYEVKLGDVASAMWLSVPDGWDASLNATSLQVTAPSEAEDGLYTLRLMAVSSKGLAKQYDFFFTYKGYIFYDDFETGDIPDPKYWVLCPRKYTQGYTMYMPETYENTYLQDGKLVLKAIKTDGVYKSAGVQTTFGFDKCKVELSAKFTKMVTSGINSAAWLFPWSRMVWPNGGEVDIFEHLNNDSAVWQTCHTHYSVNLGFDPDDKHRKVGIDPEKFNTYRIDLTAEAVIFYINGFESFRYANKHLPNESEMQQYPFWDGDFYLLLDCCLGTEWPGPIVDADLPGIMEVDWVRISKLDD